MTQGGVSEFSNLASQRVFGHDFGRIHGNLVATGCNGNSGMIVANLGSKIENRQILTVRTG